MFAGFLLFWGFGFFPKEVEGLSSWQAVSFGSASVETGPDQPKRATQTTETSKGLLVTRPRSSLLPHGGHMVFVSIETKNRCSRLRAFLSGSKQKACVRFFVLAD